MPKEFYNIATRIDHILSALLPGNIEKLNISERFDLSVKLPTHESEMTSIKINDIATTMPLSYEVNYGNLDQIAVDYGINSICSLYRNNLNTFAQKPEQLTSSMKSEYSNNGEVLLAAECSDAPRIAIFVGYKNETNFFSYIKIYTAGHVLTIMADGEPLVMFNGETHNIKEAAFEYPPFQSDFK